MLPLLETLKEAWEYRVLVLLFVISFLVAFCKRQSESIASLRTQLASRPAVHEEADQQIKIVRVAGPVKVETKTVYVPGTTQIQYVDRVVERAPVTTTEQKDSKVVESVQPACLPVEKPRGRRYRVEALFDPLAQRRLVGGRVGATWWGWLETDAGLRVAPLAGDVGIGVRF